MDEDVQGRVLKTLMFGSFVEMNTFLNFDISHGCFDRRNYMRINS